jgi:biotin synthase
MNFEYLSQLINSPARYDFSREEIAEVYNMPMTQLMFVASGIHQKNHKGTEVQLSNLLSIKTGGCKEKCGYCSQSAHNEAEVDSHGLLSEDKILDEAQKAKDIGASRFCMGAAWRTPPKTGPGYERLLSVAEKVKGLGLEVCMTLGMLDENQANDLKEAGVDYYNHNLDTSREYYKKVITSRTYDDRLDTLDKVRKSGMKICSGGIVGMGEELKDRYGLLEELNHLNPHPESVPINKFVKISGTPIDGNKDFDSFDLVRMVATARIVLPNSEIRLSAGRKGMSEETQAMCFMAGASSIFTGERLLTADNPGIKHDKGLLEKMGLTPVVSEAKLDLGDAENPMFQPKSCNNEITH